MKRPSILPVIVGKQSLTFEIGLHPLPEKWSSTLLKTNSLWILGSVNFILSSLYINSPEPRNRGRNAWAMAIYLLPTHANLMKCYQCKLDDEMIMSRQFGQDSSHSSLTNVNCCHENKVTINDKISRLPVPPLEVWAIY